MKITYCGLEYETTDRGDAYTLAARLGVAVAVNHLHARGARQDLIDQTLWAQILLRAPGSLGGPR